MKGFPQVVALASEAALQATQAAAAADNHSLHAPTHAFQRDGEIVGAVSLGGSVTALCWFHSGKLRARDTAGLINAMENALRIQGVKSVLVPVAADSPIFPHLAVLGFRDAGPFHLFVKTL